MTSLRDLAVPLLLSSGMLTSACAHRQPPPRHAPHFPSVLHVTGHGEASAAPDIARTSVGVEVRAPEASQATEQANQRMGRVLSALKEAGVAGEDLRTDNLSLRFEQHSPEQPRPLPAEPQPRKGAADGERATTSVDAEGSGARQPEGFYVASNMVEVTVRDLGNVSKVLSAATSAGADQLWGIRFELEDPKSLLREAREKAVRDAEASAEQLAALTGVTLGPVVSIGDGAAHGGGPVPMMGARAESASAAPSPMPVEGGQLTVSHQVSVTYRLD